MRCECSRRKSTQINERTTHTYTIFCLLNARICLNVFRSFFFWPRLWCLPMNVCVYVYVCVCVHVFAPRNRATLYYHFKLRAQYKSLCTKANLPVHSRLHCNYITQTNLDRCVSKSENAQARRQLCGAVYILYERKAIHFEFFKIQMLANVSTLLWKHCESFGGTKLTWIIWAI